MMTVGEVQKVLTLGGLEGGPDHDETLSTHWKGVQHICTPSHTQRLCTLNATTQHNTHNIR